MKVVKLSDSEYQNLLYALNEAISAQSFYLNMLRDESDERTSAEIEQARDLFEGLQARLYNE